MTKTQTKVGCHGSSGSRPSRWQILRDGFDSRLEPIAFHIFIYRVATDSKSSLLLLNFQCNSF